MRRRPPRSTRTDTLFPYTRSSDLERAWTRRQVIRWATAARCINKARYARCSAAPAAIGGPTRSDEHTSELKSLMRSSYAVFCLNQKTMKLNDDKTKSARHITITQQVRRQLHPQTS